MAMPPGGAGFVPPPYPHDRLAATAAVAEQIPGGMVDCSVGSPVDPMPAFVVEALLAAAPGATEYPKTIGTREFRDGAAGWILRRFGVRVDPGAVMACVGTKELVASLGRLLSLRDPHRDTVLYPAISYPTYAMGATLAGLRAVPVPVDARWRLDLDRVSEQDAARALLLWCNDPSNPTGAGASPDEMRATVEWARHRGVIVASDECYAEFTFGDDGRPAPPVTALHAGDDHVLALHSLSKRSNMAGLRAGFVAGDPALVTYLGEVRKHAGLIVPSPVQAAAAAALRDDTHVEAQRARYAARRKRLLPAFEALGLVHDGGPSTFYLWLRDAATERGGWAVTTWLAEHGVLVAPGDLYGESSAEHVRVALTVTDAKVDTLMARLEEAGAADVARPSGMARG